MIGIILMIIVGIICEVICYKMTDSIPVTILYGIHIGLIIFIVSLFA